MIPWKWFAGGVGIGAILLYLLLPPRVETRTVTHEVVKWKTVERITAGPGAVTTLHPDGTTTIAGPIEFTRSAEGGVTRDTDTSVRAHRPAWRVMVSTGAFLPRATWQVMAAARVGHVLFLDVGVYAGVEGHLTGVMPSRFGGGVVLTF